MKGLEAKTLGLRKVIRHEYKRIVAFMLTVAMVVTNFGTNLTVAFAAGEEESSLFLLNSSELEDAISAALESGDVFDFSSLELKAKQKSLKTSYEKLIGSKAGKVYQLDVDIDSSYATEHTDLQVFYNAGTDDVVFLFINESDMAVTFRANVSGYETARVTVNPNTTNIEDAEGVENAEDYSGTTMVDDEKKPQAEVVKPEGETSESESASDETEAAETEADVTESENASENGEAEETTGAEGTAETETSAAEETEAETEPETETEAPAAEEAEEEIELTPEEGSASASISAKKVFRVSTSAEAAVEAPAADAEEETEAEEPEKETEALVETTAEETVADDSTEETIADETQADETTAADETDGELTEETEAPTEDVTAPDETTGEQPAGNDGSENIGFDNDEQFLEDDSIELAGELNGKAYNTVTIWGSANARAYVVKAEDLTGEAAVEGQYSVDYSVDPVGAATIKGAHTVNEGETLYFAVDPQVGYEITEVTANGEPLEEADAADVASASDLEQHEHVYAVEAVTEDLEIVASLEETVGVAHPEFSASYVSSEGVTISLHAEEGILPEGTELSVTEVTDALGDTIKEKMDSEAEGTTVHSVLAYDINLLYNGKKLSNSWSESGYVDVTFTGAPIQEMTEASDKVEIVAVDDTSKTQLSAENAAEAEAGELKLETVSEQNVEDTAVEEVGFKAEHFTIYAVATMAVTRQTTVDATVEVGKYIQIDSNKYAIYNSWSSDKTGIATASGTTNSAVVRGISVGEATITHQYRNYRYGEWQTESFVIQVVAGQPSITLSPTSVTLNKMGETKTLTATIKNMSQESTINWTTDNPEVATVSNGVVTARGKGTATITATAIPEDDALQGQRYTATATVTVAFTTQKLYYYALIPGKSDESTDGSSADNSWFGIGVAEIEGVPAASTMSYGVHTDLNYKVTKITKTLYPDITMEGKTYKYAATGSPQSYQEGYYTLIPYRIVVADGANAGNNSYNPTARGNQYHLDHTIVLNEKDYRTVTFNVQYPETTEPVSLTDFSQRVPDGTKESTLKKPTTKELPTTMQQDGVTYELKSWYKDKACTTKADFNGKITANTAYYAKYVPINQKYTVEYYYDGAIDESRTDILGPVALGTQISEFTPKAKDGYTFDRAEPTALTVTADASQNVIKVYYTKRNVGYSVRYVLNDTDEDIWASDNTGIGKWGDVPSATYKEIPGYTFVPEQDTTKSITLGAGKNEIVFFYYKNVTLQANSGEFTYDGQPHSVSDYTWNQDGKVTNIEIDGVTASATATDQGEYPVNFSGDNPVGKVINGKYYVTAAFPGTLTINKNNTEIVVEITGHTAELKYNGQEQSVEGFDLEIKTDPTGLYQKSDVALAENAEAKASGTNAWIPVYPMNLTSSSFRNTNTNFSNVKFVIKEDGWLKIAKRPVTLTSHGANKKYDGTPLMNTADPAVSGDGFVDGQGVTYKNFASITDFGDTDNTFDINYNQGTDERNYDITKKYGKLIVTQEDTDVVVTITGHKINAVYDGSAKTAEGYDVTITGSETYTQNDFRFSGTASVTETNADTYPMGLAKEQFENINTNFTSVRFVVTDGELKIAKRQVTLTSAGAEKTYDGIALTNGTVTESGLLEADKANLKYETTGSQLEVGESDNHIKFEFLNGAGKNYTVTRSLGKLKVNPVTNKVTVTITEHGGKELYDGTTKTATGYDVATDNSLYTSADFEFTGNASVSGVDAGDYEMQLNPEDFQNKNTNFTDVEFKIVDGVLKIEKRTVLLTSKSDSKVYDGTALTNHNVDVTGDGFVSSDEPDYDFTGTITNVGNTPNSFTYTFEDTVNQNNYSISKKEGTLEITPVTKKVTVTITGHTGGEKYNGAEQTVKGYDVAISDDLYTVNDFTFSGTDHVSGTNAESYPMGLKTSNFTNINENFDAVEFVVQDGGLTIEKRVVTLTSGSASKAYDGTPLTKEEVSVSGDGFVSGEGAQYSNFASLTEVNEKDNTFDYTLNADTLAGNYNITKAPGKLVVTQNNTEVVVTITGHTGTVKYDGKEHSVTGYDVTSISNNAYTTSDFTFSGDDTVTRTDVGSYVMGLNKTDFTNNNARFSNVKFVVTDGKLDIEKRTVTMTSANAEKIYDGTPLTNHQVTVSGDGFAEGEGATYEVTGTLTEVGTTPNSFSYRLQNVNVDNYILTATAGTLKVTPVTDEVVVTINGTSGIAKYDGTEKSVSGYTAVADNPKYPVDSSVEFSGSATVSETNAGTYTKVLESSQFKNINKNFTNVRFVVNDPVKLEINPRQVTLTSASDHKTYDGTALTNHNVTEGGEDGFVTGEGAAYDVTGTITNVGEADNDFTYTLKDNTLASNYNITKGLGKLRIDSVTDKVTVTITGNTKSVIYDGNEHDAIGYTSSISNKLYTAADFKFNGSAEVKGTNAKDSYPMGLKATDFENLSKNFTNVEFVVNDGYLKIDPRQVTLTSASDSKVYDGNPLTNHDVAVGGDGFVEGEGASYDVTGTQTTAGTSDNTFTYTLNAGTNADNYEINKDEGKLIVTATKDEVVVTITEQSGSFLYNGTEHTVAGYTVTNISNPLYHEADFTFTGNAEVKATDAGTYDMELKEADFHNINASFEKVKFVIVDGNLTIEKRKVTLASANASKVYDGEALTAQTVTVTAGDGFAEGEGATYKVTGSQTKVGTSENTFTYNLNGNTKPENYDIELVYGKLEVTPVTEKITVTIKGHTETVKYDGDEHSVTGYDVTIPAGSLYTEKDITFSGKADAKGTDADTYNMGLKAENFANSNGNFANVEFVVKEDGKLTITKRDVTLTSADAEKVYDGTALTNDTVTVSGDGFVKNDGATYDVTGTITNVGTKPNTFTYTLKEGTKADNYNITLKEGNLEINPITDEVVVTIAEHSNSAKYNGKEHKAEGYDVTRISNDLYHESDFSFTGDASHKTVAATNAGSYDMGLLAGDFTNNNGNFTNVRFSIEDGKLEIAKRDVTLTSGTGSKTYDGTALTNDTVTVGGDKFADGEGASYNVTGSQTEAGSSYNTFTYTLNEGTNEDNYNITKTEGKLTVSPSASEIIVTITGHTGSKTYDGAEMTVTGYDVSISNPAYTEGDFSFKGNGTLSKTDAGSYSMGLKASDFANTNGNYSNVIFNVTDGSLEIAKRQVTLTSATDQKTYDGAALTNDSVAVSEDGFADGEGATYKVTGSQTNAGNSENTFTYTLNDGTKAENYEIKEVEGTLTVDPREITITADEASKYVGEADPEDYISTPGVVTRIMRWIRPAAAFGATVTSGEVVAGDKLAFKVTRPGAGTDEARGTYKDAVTVTETDAAANANYKITWIPADFHIYEDGLKVEKTVKAPTAPKTVFELGDVIEFNIKVTNTGNTDLKDVIVKDELDGATIVANTGEYTVNADGTATIAVLAAGASVDVKATYTVKAADLGNTSFTNKATATAKTENPKNPDGKVTGEDETDPIAIDSRTTGGGNSGGGGGGGSSSGPRDNGGSSSGGPGTTTVTIDPDAVPLANLPNEDGADNLLMIDDEDVPLAALPKTGQSGTNGLVFFLSSMMLAAFVAVTKKREDDK